MVWARRYSFNTTNFRNPERIQRASSMGLLKSEVLKNLCQVEKGAEDVLGFINPKQNIEDALHFINLF